MTAYEGGVAVGGQRDAEAEGPEGGLACACELFTLLDEWIDSHGILCASRIDSKRDGVGVQFEPTVKRATTIVGRTEAAIAKTMPVTAAERDGPSTRGE